VVKTVNHRTRGMKIETHRKEIRETTEYTEGAEKHGKRTDGRAN
jgi:hypothetical protein